MSNRGRGRGDYRGGRGGRGRGSDYYDRGDGERSDHRTPRGVNLPTAPSQEGTGRGGGNSSNQNRF